MKKHLLANLRNRTQNKVPQLSFMALLGLSTSWACSTDVDYPNMQNGSAGAGSSVSEGNSSAGRSSAPDMGSASKGGSSADSGGGGAASSSGTPEGGTPAAGGTAAGGAPAAGTGGTPMTGGPMKALDCDTTEQQALAILEKNCDTCHGAGTNISNFNYLLSTSKLKSGGKVVPGDPEASPIYTKISRNEMPPPGAAQRPSAPEVDLLYNWIKACTVVAPPTGGANACGTPPVDTTTMVRTMVSDISQFDLQDRAFIRYFSLAHVRNAGACEPDLDIYRFALAKTVNSLSQGTRIAPLEAIDKERTIFRVDIRDFEWDASGNRSDKWELYAGRSAYTVQLEDDDSIVLQQFAQTNFPVLMGDAFVDEATDAALYYDMLDIPNTRQELERSLGINVDTDIENGDVWRAGFLDSGISEQNRIIERHDLPVSSARSYWISWDFAGDGGEENIFAAPLDFEEDGSEIIFTLPNGMQGYMLTAAAGTRLNEAPDAVVSDPSQPNGNVNNGISCIGCHVDGIKNKPDEIRAYVQDSSDFDTREKQEVEELYAPRTEMDSLILRDSRTFLDAVAALNPPAGVKDEPVLDVFQRFESNVDLKTAAAELGVTPAALLRKLGALDPGLSQLGYGTVKRSTFRDNFAESVCLLNVGIADDAACRGRGDQSSNDGTASGSRNNGTAGADSGNTGTGGADGAGTSNTSTGGRNRIFGRRR